MEFTEEKLLERYKELVAKRDAVYATVAPLESKLEELNEVTNSYRAKAAEVAAEIDKHFDATHFARKKEIALIARTLSRPNGPLTS